MRDNHEHDPLDSWLSQQVRPLPPPPGTFELITRRARRRKIRRLAVTAGSAVAVAAAVALAVPGGLLLRVNPSSTANGVAAGQQTHPTPSGGSQDVTGHGTRTQSGSPTPAQTNSPSPAISSFTAPLGPVPANFQPSSVTFVDTHHAWVIGQAGTPGHCADANPDFCTSVVRTDNAGQTWHGGPAPKTGPSTGTSGVSSIRFLDGVNGWAFGPELWVTHNAGNSWYQLPTNGQLVIGLETAGDRAFAVWASCPTQGTEMLISTGVVTGCTSFTLMSTLAGSDDWQPVGPGTTGLTPAPEDQSVKIVLSATVGYLYLVSPVSTTLYSGPLNGTWQKVGTLPCQGEGGLGGIALAGSTQLSALCDGSSPPTLLRSDDGGQTWTQSAVTWPEPAPVMPANSTQTSWVAWSLTAAPDGTLVLATDSGLYVLPVGGTQWKLTNATGSGGPAGGFSYVGMTTDEQGVAVPWDTSLHEIWMTFDGGQTWAPTAPITPGN